MSCVLDVPTPQEKIPSNYIIKIAIGHIVILEKKGSPSTHMASLQSDWSTFWKTPSSGLAKPKYIWNWL